MRRMGTSLTFSRISPIPHIFSLHLVAFFSVKAADCCNRRIQNIEPQTIRIRLYKKTRQPKCSYKIPGAKEPMVPPRSVSYTHLRAHETDSYLVCRLLLEKKKNNT